MYQTTIRLTHQIRDARAIHRAIAHDTHPDRALWAQPAPRTLIVRTPRDMAWSGFPHAAAITTALARTRYPTGQAVDWALVANPTRNTRIPGQRGRRTGIITPADAEQWAQQHLAPALTLHKTRCERTTPVRGADRLTLTRWAYAGTATVTNPDALTRLLTEGVGRGKAFGCGMLIVREAR